MKNFLFSRWIAGAIVALAISVTFTSSLEARQRRDGGSGDGAPFTGIVAFGDSLTDTGNIFALTGGYYPDPAYYYDGHFSNGMIWIEYLAEAMGIEPESVTNYAVGGATTGRDNVNDPYFSVEFPGLQDEIDLFESDLNGKKADKRALHVVWAGSNDFLNNPDPSQALETIATGVGNTVVAVQRLHRAGARRIMVVNMPDLGLLPYADTLENIDPATLSYLSGIYNDALASALDGLAETGVQTVRVDASGVLQAAVSNPGDFGFTNVLDAYLLTGIFLGADPSGFLFWDPYHITTRGHFLMAEEAIRVLRREFRHAWGTPRLFRK